MLTRSVTLLVKVVLLSASLTEETGTTIEIEDDGTVKIAATDGKQAEDAINRIKALTAEIEVGALYTR